MSRWPAFLVILTLLLATPCVQAVETGSDSQATGTVNLAKKRPMVGLALGGGGARGAAHVAILKALEKEGVPIDMIAGTSIGAIVGGLYCAGVSLDVLQKKFDDRSLMKAFMTVPLTVRLVAAPVLAMPRLLGSRPYDGLYKGNKFRNYLERTVPPCEQNIEDLRIPFSAIALNIVDGKVQKLTRGNLGYALQASSAVPGLRKPVQIGDQLFVDGGVFANVPVPQVKEMGADFIIAVNIDERLKPVPLDDFRRVGSVAKRIILLQLAELDDAKVEGADVVLHPNVDGIGLISTKREDAKRAYEAGEIAINEAMPKLKKKLHDLGITLNPPSPKVAGPGVVE